MSNHKVCSVKDNGNFVKTASFYKLFSVLKSLKTSRGRFVLVLGSPGTGKSANIYKVLSVLDINVYDAFLFIDKDSKPDEVYRIFWDTIEEDMGAKSIKKIFKKAEEYDLILFADPFLDSEYFNSDKVGLGLWTEENGPSTFPFYFKVLWEYLKHFRDLKNVNIVAQIAWVFKYKGVRYDLLTDFGYLSKILVFFLKRFFEVVLISYTAEEMIEICRSQHGTDNDEKIEKYIKKYGNKPRFIFEAIDEEEKPLN